MSREPYSSRIERALGSYLALDGGAKWRTELRGRLLLGLAVMGCLTISYLASAIFDLERQSGVLIFVLLVYIAMPTIGMLLLARSVLRGVARDAESQKSGETGK